MAITIVKETGAIVANANSYCTLADATTYHSDRGNSAWAEADTADKNAALVRATFDLENMYKNKWVGVKTQSWIASDGSNATPVQSLAWPRVEKAHETDPTLLTDVDGLKIQKNEVPLAVRHAQFELALIELSTRVVGGVVNEEDAVQSVSVGPISKTFFEKGAEVDKYPHIDMILTGLVPAGGASAGINVVFGLTEDEVNQGNSEEYWLDPAWFHQAGA